MFEKNSQNNKLELLGKLNASFVHEIRNPLFALKLNLDFIKSYENLPPEVHESFTSCIEAVERIDILVSDILEFSRKTNSEPGYCSVNDVTMQAMHLLTGYAHKNFCEIIKEFDDNIPLIQFDKNKLLQVIINLMTNAIEASNQSKKVIVRTYLKDSRLIWEVQDFGSGISQEDKDLIFEEFFTQKKNGTGLGLSICKKILNEHKANLDFETTYGTGSRFFIMFNINGKADQHEF